MVVLLYRPSLVEASAQRFFRVVSKPSYGYCVIILYKFSDSSAYIDLYKM